MRSIRYFGLAQAVCLVLAAAGASEMALQIGSDRQVFVDRFVISKMRGLSLELHAPVPREVAIAFDRPWEEVGSNPIAPTNQSTESRAPSWCPTAYGPLALLLTRPLPRRTGRRRHDS